MDGEIVLWNLNENEVRSTLNGHKAGITVIRFNNNDSLLFSGS